MEKGICFPYYVFNSNEPGLLARASDNITRFYELIIPLRFFSNFIDGRREIFCSTFLFKFYRWKTRDLLLYVTFLLCIGFYKRREREIRSRSRN